MLIIYKNTHIKVLNVGKYWKLIIFANNNEDFSSTKDLIVQLVNNMHEVVKMILLNIRRSWMTLKKI